MHRARLGWRSIGCAHNRGIHHHHHHHHHGLSIDSSRHRVVFQLRSWFSTSSVQQEQLQHEQEQKFHRDHYKQDEQQEQPFASSSSSSRSSSSLPSRMPVGVFVDLDSLYPPIRHRAQARAFVKRCRDIANKIGEFSTFQVFGTLADVTFVPELIEDALELEQPWKPNWIVDQYTSSSDPTSDHDHESNSSRNNKKKSSYMRCHVCGVKIHLSKKDYEKEHTLEDKLMHHMELKHNPERKREKISKMHLRHKRSQKLLGSTVSSSSSSSNYDDDGNVFYANNDEYIVDEIEMKSELVELEDMAKKWMRTVKSRSPRRSIHEINQVVEDSEFLLDGSNRSSMTTTTKRPRACLLLVTQTGYFRKLLHNAQHHNVLAISAMTTITSTKVSRSGQNLRNAPVSKYEKLRRSSDVILHLDDELHADENDTDDDEYNDGEMDHEDSSNQKRYQTFGGLTLRAFTDVGHSFLKEEMIPDVDHDGDSVVSHTKEHHRYDNDGGKYNTSLYDPLLDEDDDEYDRNSNSDQHDRRFHRDNDSDHVTHDDKHHHQTRFTLDGSSSEVHDDRNHVLDLTAKSCESNDGKSCNDPNDEVLSTAAAALLTSPTTAPFSPLSTKLSENQVMQALENQYRAKFGRTIPRQPKYLGKPETMTEGQLRFELTDRGLTVSPTEDPEVMSVRLQKIREAEAEQRRQEVFSIPCVSDDYATELYWRGKKIGWLRKKVAIWKMALAIHYAPFGQDRPQYQNALDIPDSFGNMSYRVKKLGLPVLQYELGRRGIVIKGTDTKVMKHTLGRVISEENINFNFASVRNVLKERGLSEDGDMRELEIRLAKSLLGVEPDD